MLNLKVDFGRGANGLIGQTFEAEFVHIGQAMVKESKDKLEIIAKAGDQQLAKASQVLCIVGDIISL